MKNIKQLIVIVMLFAPFYAAQAQNLDIVDEPICFLVVNKADHEINGHIMTDKYPRPDGLIDRHKENFRLQAAGSRDPEKGYPTDRVEFCSYGPFYPGRKLDLTIKTLFPVFSCKTRIDKGPILIHSEPRTEDVFGGVNMWADCYD